VKFRYPALAVIVLALLARPGRPDGSGDWCRSALVTGPLVTSLGCALLALALVLIARGGRPSWLRRPATPWLGTTALLAPSVVAFAIGAGWLLLLAWASADPEGAQRLLSEDPFACLSWLPPRERALALANLVILGPLAEEILFRGALLEIALARHLKWQAILLTSLLFGLLHLDLVGALVFGLVACQLRVVTGSLLPGVVIHVLNNATVAMAETRLDDAEPSTIAEVATWWPIGAGFAVLGGAGILAGWIRLRKTDRPTAEAETPPPQVA
jgi:membrane protease YdiL (CAAX protease family)